MSQGGNITPYAGQLYRLTYPEKNAVWWAPYPDNCTRERKKECCQRMLYTPTPASQCSSTFMPWDRPDPYQCLKLCKGIDVFKVSGCQAENSQYRTRLNNNGCLREPSATEYTNKPFNNLCAKGQCGSQSVITNPQRNPPNPPQYGYKDSNAYDPIRYVFGNSYLY